MNWALPSSLDEIWRSPTVPMWLTLAAAGFFALILLITLLRAERSVANGALTVITLLAIGIAVAATLRGFGGDRTSAARGGAWPQPGMVWGAGRSGQGPKPLAGRGRVHERIYRPRGRGARRPPTPLRAGDRS